MWAGGRASYRYTNQLMSKQDCAQKIALLADVQKEMGALMAIHSDEIAALLRRDVKEIIRLRRKLAAARDRKAAAIDLYLEHVRSHDC